MQAGRLGHLGQIHGAKLSGTDQSHPNWPSLGLALSEFCVQIHGILPERVARIVAHSKNPMPTVPKALPPKNRFAKKLYVK